MSELKPARDIPEIMRIVNMLVTTQMDGDPLDQQQVLLEEAESLGIPKDQILELLLDFSVSVIQSLSINTGVDPNKFLSVYFADVQSFYHNVCEYVEDGGEEFDFTYSDVGEVMVEGMYYEDEDWGDDDDDDDDGGGGSPVPIGGPDDGCGPEMKTFNQMEGYDED